MNEADRLWAAYSHLSDTPRERLPEEMQEELDALELRLHTVAEEIQGEIIYE